MSPWGTFCLHAITRVTEAAQAVLTVSSLAVHHVHWLCRAGGRCALLQLLPAQLLDEVLPRHHRGGWAAASALRLAVPGQVRD